MSDRREREVTAQGSSVTSPYSITEKILQDRLNKPILGHIGRQLFAGILACLSSLSFGTSLGWADSVSQSMIDEQEGEDNENMAWLVSILLLGCSLGVTSASFLMQQMGPKRVLRVVGPFYIINWLLIITPSVQIQLAGRFFLGFLGISYSTAGENLLLHTVHHGIRRYITVFHASTMVLGVLVSRVLGTVISRTWLTVVCAFIPILHYVLIQIVPESPVFLYATSHVAAAKSLAWYRGDGNFYMDMASIKKDWDASRLDSDAYRYMLMSRVVYRPLLFIIGISFLQANSAYFIFMFYSMRTLSRGEVAISPLMDSTIVAGFFVLSKLFWGTLHTMYTWKIRGFMICSCFFSAVLLAGFATSLVLREYDIRISEVYWAPMLIIVVFVFCFDMGLNHFPKTLIFEYMPYQMYKRAFTINQSLFWLFVFFHIFVFSATFDDIETHIPLGVFSAFMFIGGLLCYLFMVEPRGKSLIQVQLEFGGNPIGTRGALYNQARQTL